MNNEDKISTSPQERGRDQRTNLISCDFRDDNLMGEPLIPKLSQEVVTRGDEKMAQIRTPM